MEAAGNAAGEGLCFCNYLRIIALIPFIHLLFSFCFPIKTNQESIFSRIKNLRTNKTRNEFFQQKDTLDQVFISLNHASDLF